MIDTVQAAWDRAKDFSAESVTALEAHSSLLRAINLHAALSDEQRIISPTDFLTLTEIAERLDNKLLKRERSIKLHVAA